MNKTLINNIIDFLLPQLVIAGDYASEIQSRVSAQQDKKMENSNAFSEALTDADLSVQNFVEIVLLSRFPDIGFFGEEDDSSLNTKYFKNNLGIKAFLDPIDGTLYYKSGSPLFSIIVTICSESEILANIIYQPAKKECFIGRLNEGTYKLSRTDMLEGLEGEKLSIKPESKKIITYKTTELQKLDEQGYKVIDIVKDFDGSPDYPNDVVGILNGKISAHVNGRPQLIDCLSIAFAAKEAGCILTGTDGSTVNLTKAISTGVTDPIVISINQETSQKIIEILN